MRFPRAAGILLHPTSLSGPFGIGDLGKTAYEFVDFLAMADQTLWQVLPLGPTGYGDSPYQSFSAFAGNPFLVSPQRLVEDGYLPANIMDNVPNFPVTRVDYGPVIEYKNWILSQAHDHFLQHGQREQQEAYHTFCQANSEWLEDFALFMAVKQAHVEHEGGVWNTWPEEIAFRDPAGITSWREKLAFEVDRYRFEQFLFFQQWQDLKSYANHKGIQLVGDIPIFVAFDSADVWSHPELFYLNDDGSPAFVAGVPPDYFSETGQRWGNPLYRWDKMSAQGYPFWKARLSSTLTLFDIVRIDHFRGFEAYWEIPAEEPTAVKGRWVKGPAKELFHSLQQSLGELPIIAEDLGVITPEVEALRDEFDFPGMKILQFAFGGTRSSEFLPHNYHTPNCVVYTGTHDNETTLGWFRNADEYEKDHVRRYLASDGRGIVWDLIRLAHMSIADMVVIPMQDLLELGNEARMNYPSKESGNWQWRFPAGMLTQELAMRLREITNLYGRAPLADNVTQ